MPSPFTEPRPASKAGPISTAPFRLGSKLAGPLLLLLVTGICVVAGELAMRWISPAYFGGPRAYDPELGWIAKPRQILYWPRRQSGTLHYATNNIGIRDREHRGGGPGIRRITVVGDSFTEAAEVDDEHTFTSRLRTKLNLGRRDTKEYWEIKRLGMGDYGPLQEFMALRRHGLFPNPKVVVLQLFPYNDILNASLPGAYWVSNQDAYRPYLSSTDGFVQPTYLNPKTSKLRRHSWLTRFSLLLAQRHLGAWGRERLFESDESRLDWLRARLPELGLPADLDPTLLPMSTFSPPEQQLAAVQEGWGATDMVVRRFLRLTEKRKIHLVVLVIPHLRQLSPVLERRRSELPFDVDPRYAERRLAGLLEGSDARLVPLLDLFEQHLTTVLPYIDGHLNIAAHDLVADRLLQELVDAGWADVDAPSVLQTISAP